MDLFGEKKYEDLDLLTKMIEPVTWSLLDVINKLPEQVEVPHKMLLDQFARTMSIDFNTCWEELVLADIPLASHRERDYLRRMYSLEIEEGAIVDFSTSTITGKVCLVRTKELPDEKELNTVLKQTGDWMARYHFGKDDEATIARAKEILDLFGTETAQAGIKKRTMPQIQSALVNAWKDVMYKNRWNIRSVDLAYSVSRWIATYVNDGNLAAMRNFCLLKAATHRGYPIYTIDEEAL